MNHLDPSGHITLKQRYELNKKQYGKTIADSRAYQLEQKRMQFSRAAARWVNGWLGQVTERLYTAAGRSVPSVKAWPRAGKELTGQALLKGSRGNAESSIAGWGAPIFPTRRCCVRTRKPWRPDRKRGSKRHPHRFWHCERVSKGDRKTVLRGVESVNSNTLHHIFDDPEHGSGAFGSYYNGSQEDAFRAIENAAISYSASQNVVDGSKGQCLLLMAWISKSLTG